MSDMQAPVEQLEIAARCIDKSIAQDEAAPSLYDLLNIHPPQSSTASGLADIDYPIIGGSFESISQMKLESKVPLPPEILEHFNHIQCHCMMGLFPEIKRAWLTVDSDIYVWSYENNSDLAYYDGLNETILSIGLVKPKPGVFHAFIKHLLVLTTAVDIIVLGITFTENATDPLYEIQLIPDPVFTLPTDGATISVIASTDLGRLFLGTKEGCLLEIVYQAESGWFSKRCKKVNHSISSLSFLVPSFINAALSEEDGIVQIAVDNTRHILYTLTEKGAIEVYDLGASGATLSRVTRLNQGTLVNQAVSIVKTLDSQNFRPIVGISTVEAAESSQVYLVAVTQTGVRFYLTTHALSTVPNPRPYTLYLLHVRLPPGYSANVTIRPRAVHLSHYKDRNLVLLSTVNEKDVLWVMSSDLFPFRQNLMEAYTMSNLDGAALALAEIPQENPLSVLSHGASPLAVRQHAEPAKKYVILTSEGVYIFSKLKPVDVLRQILGSQFNDEHLRGFFVVENEDQACATSLIIAALDLDGTLKEGAGRAFLQYGGEPRLTTMNQFPNSFAPNVVSTPAHHHLSAPSNYPSFEVSTPFNFSSKHNGLYLFLGRILEPIWLRRCVEKVCLDGSNVVSTSTITSSQAARLFQYLTGLNAFLLANTQITSCAPVNALNATTRLDYTIQDAQSEETQSLNALKVFVAHAAQVVGLWRILTEHQVHILIGALPPNYQTHLQEIKFKDLFLYGHEICGALILTLVNSYLGDNASVDSISAKLRDVCPRLYKMEDATFSKANEMLKQAKNTMNVDEKEELIQTSLELCKSITPNINLRGICKEFAGLKAYLGVIDLCVMCAKKVDPDSVAESFYKAGAPSGDQEGRNFYSKRMLIYQEVFNMLDALFPPAGDVQTGVSALLKQLINEILDVKDAILHVGLYDWMLRKNLTSELIEITNNSLETYLLHTSQQNPNDLQVADLLWKYYENNQNHAAAAKILDNLAGQPGNALGLNDRLEYLTRAIMCMRSDKVGYAPYLGVFLRDLEDKMDVAKVQEKVLNAVLRFKGIHPLAEEAIVALNSGLYQITQLYENFADPLELWECQLAIIDCANYADNNLIEKIWYNILKKEVNNSKGSPNIRMERILGVVGDLAREFGYSAKCFALGYIVLELEKVATCLKCDKYLIAKALESMEVPMDLLLEIYARLIASAPEIKVWQNDECEFHLFESVAALIERFLNNHSRYNNVDKRKIISQSQDIIASLLSTLYSKPDTDKLINVLRNIQSRLSRL